MPAVSKAQQRFFGMVRATQKGEMKNPSSEILDVADDISVKDAKKMAKTKHKGLPEKVKSEGVTYGYKGKKYKKLPAHVKTPAGWGNDDRSELGKAKDAITDALGKTNTKKHGVLAKEAVKDPTKKKPKAPQFNAAKELVTNAPYMKPALQQREGVSYKDFTKTAQAAMDRIKKTKEEKLKKNAESARKDRVEKGVRFYDKKGKGYIKKGKKVYT